MNTSAFHKTACVQKRRSLVRSVRQIVSGVVTQFREELIGLVETAIAEPTTPASFTWMVEDLKTALATVGRRAFIDLVAASEEHGAMVEHGGKSHRFKQICSEEWLTPFGCVQIDRIRPSHSVGLRCPAAGRRRGWAAWAVRRPKGAGGPWSRSRSAAA